MPSRSPLRTPVLAALHGVRCPILSLGVCPGVLGQRALIQDGVQDVIKRYPPWAKEHAPGHVNGMQAKHVPVHGSWLADARAEWATLGDLLGEELGTRTPAAPKKKTKRGTDEGASEPSMSPAWPLLAAVRGRDALLVGGSPREPNRERLQHAFELASLEWPEIEGPRKVGSVVERIRRGTYGLVMVMTPFVAHAESEPIVDAAKSTGTAWALVEGYGIQTIRLGLERFLGGPRGSDGSGASGEPNGHETAAGKRGS